MGPCLLARASSVSRAVDARTQVLAVGGQDRQCLRRPESVLLLPTDRRIRKSLKDFSAPLRKLNDDSPGNRSLGLHRGVVSRDLPLRAPRLESVAAKNDD